MANNNIVFNKDFVDVFREAIGYSNIQRLDLSNNNLGNEGIGVVSCCLMFRANLRYLNVANTGFDLNGAMAFLGALSKNHTVETVIIDKN